MIPLNVVRLKAMSAGLVLAAMTLAACASPDRPANSVRRDSSAAAAVSSAPAPDTARAADSSRADSAARAGAAAASLPKVAEKDDPPYDGPSTLDGVYTDEQAARGRDVYFGSCRSCHSPQSHTGATFATWWRGKQLSDLYLFVSQRMPKNDPGSLYPEDAADVVAYLLKMNALPTGPNELYPDADSLKQYRIETRRRRSTSTATRTQP